MSIPGDNPIKRSDQDKLHREQVAKSIAFDINNVDASDGSVVAIMGPWGSGKTSMINLIRTELETTFDLAVIDFNPWMFSGTEQLVASFFSEVSAELSAKDVRYTQIAKEVSDYGELITPFASAIPFVGPWMERIGKAASAYNKLRNRKAESVTFKRKQLFEVMTEIEKPIVIVIDDIDRLETKEIRDIFKLVRLTASFPNIIYLLSFDRVRVEEALTESGLEGRSYLEKIVQIPVTLPAISEETLMTQLGEILDASLNNIDGLSELDDNRWPDTLMEIVRPLLSNMRDVRRYAATIHGSAKSLAGRVELGDLLAIEAVRIFKPDIYEEILKNKDALTLIADTYNSRQDDSAKKQIEKMLQIVDQDEEIVRSLISRIFPAASRYIGGTNYSAEFGQKWLREHRLASKSILELYLERHPSSQLQSFNSAEQLFGVMSERVEFKRKLDKLPDETIEQTISQLETFQTEYPVSSVVPASIVLLNKIPDIPEHIRQGIFDIYDARLVVTRVVLRLLRRLQSPQDVNDAVKLILPELKTLSSKAELIGLIGYNEGRGHHLVDESDAVHHQEVFASETKQASPSTLSKEWNLLRILYDARLWSTDNSLVHLPTNNSKLSASLLKSAKSIRTSQSFETRHFKHIEVLYWDSLNELLETEDRLKAVIRSAQRRADIDPGLPALLELAQKYIDGWNPDSDND